MYKMNTIRKNLQYLWNILKNLYKNNGIVISWYNIIMSGDGQSSHDRYSQKKESEIIKTIKYSQSDMVNIAELRLYDIDGKNQIESDNIAYTLARRLNMNIGCIRS